MAEAERLRIERQVGLGVIVAVIVQAGAVLLWAGRTAERIDQLELRLEAQAGVVERLARLEEQAVATRTVLGRIEEQAAASRAALERIEARLERTEGRERGR